LATPKEHYGEHRREHHGVSHGAGGRGFLSSPSGRQKSDNPIDYQKLAAILSVKRVQKWVKMLAAKVAVNA